MNNEEKILQRSMKAYQKGTNLETYFEDLLEIVQRLCEVVKDAREIKDRIDACVNDTDLQHSFAQLDALEIE